MTAQARPRPPFGKCRPLTSPAAEPASQLWLLLRRVVHVEPREAKALLYSFAYFFAVLTAYYIIRPVRDEMSVMLGEASLRWVFLYVFLVMLAAVPVFGTIVQRFPRRHVVPVVYGFFIACLVGFWLAFQSFGQTRWLAQAFFIWVSVFNLFVVSLFWSLMADLWKSDQAKRLYGFVAAGGSAGALTGPFITQALVKAIGPNALLLISAGFLALALWFVFQLRTELAGREEENGDASQRDHGIWAGAVQVWQSPYLFRIALWVMFANLILTYFYLEQARIVGVAIPERTDRVRPVRAHGLRHQRAHDPAAARRHRPRAGAHRRWRRRGVDAGDRARRLHRSGDLAGARHDRDHHGRGARGRLRIRQSGHAGDVDRGRAGGEVQGAELHRYGRLSRRRCRLGLDVQLAEGDRRRRRGPCGIDRSRGRDLVVGQSQPRAGCRPRRQRRKARRRNPEPPCLRSIGPPPGPPRAP